MGLLSTWLTTEAAAGTGSRPGPDDDFWFEPLQPAAAAGIRVGVREALRVPAVRRSVTVLAGSIASLPLRIYQRRNDGGREKANSHPLYDIVRRVPNEEMSAYSFWETIAASLMLYNDAYAEIVPGPRGAVDQLLHMPSDRVRKVRLRNGRRAFDYTDEAGKIRRLLPSEVFHVQGLTLGDINDSVIEQGADTIGSALALTRYVGRQWRNGARLSGVIEHPETLSNDAQKQLSRSWHAMYGGFENAGKTAILEEGMKFRELSQKNTDAQLYEQWQHLVAEIARLFGVPAVLLGHADKTSTYASAEQFFLSYVTHSLQPWLRNIEQAIGKQLILSRDRYFAEFNVQGLLRGDHAARADFYTAGIQNGWLSPNEVRQLENMNPRNGGDELWRPLNVEPVRGGQQPRQSSLVDPETQRPLWLP